MSEVLTAPSVDRLSSFGDADEFEKFIASCPPIETLGEDAVRVTHKFVRLYCRTWKAKRGGIFASRTHKTRHPFELSAGRIAVFTKKDGWQRFVAPYSCVTEPGTKRYIIVEEDATITTFHETDKTDILEIEKEVLEPHDNPLLTAEEKTRVIRVDQ